MTLLEQLQEAHNMHWAFRREMESNGSDFKTPEMKAAAEYGITEMGEVCDAVLRAERDDARNDNGKQYELMRELADLWLMVDTAAGEEFTPEDGRSVCEPTLEYALWCSGTYLCDVLICNGEDKFLGREANAALNAIARVEGFNLVVEVEKTLEKWKSRTRRTDTPEQAVKESQGCQVLDLR